MILIILITINNCGEAKKEANLILEDAVLSSKIKTELTKQNFLNFLKLTVISKNKIITLDGEVKSQDEKISAEILTKKFPEVKSVINKLKIAQEKKIFSNEEIIILTKIKNNLFQELGLNAFKISIDFKEKDIILKGRVKFPEEKKLAQKIISENAFCI
ncbi:MAG: BON domain-containing protein [Armatimonadetes bacterium]|nr:BON domain-containing protein [Armatimonadota bacterium]